MPVCGRMHGTLTTCGVCRRSVGVCSRRCRPMYGARKLVIGSLRTKEAHPRAWKLSVQYRDSSGKSINQSWSASSPYFHLVCLIRYHKGGDDVRNLPRGNPCRILPPVQNIKWRLREGGLLSQGHPVTGATGTGTQKAAGAGSAGSVWGETGNSAC